MNNDPLSCKRAAMTRDEHMSQIAERFPSLRHFPGVRPFDAVKLAEQYPGRSHGEQCAIRFVLMVWNGCEGFDLDDPRYANLPPHATCSDQEGLSIVPGDRAIPKFDLYEAWGTWDAKHWHAFLTWAQADWLFRP